MRAYIRIHFFIIFRVYSVFFTYVHHSGGSFAAQLVLIFNWHGNLSLDFAFIITSLHVASDFLAEVGFAVNKCSLLP